MVCHYVDIASSTSASCCIVETISFNSPKLQWSVFLSKKKKNQRKLDVLVWWKIYLKLNYHSWKKKKNSMLPTSILLFREIVCKQIGTCTIFMPLWIWLNALQLFCCKNNRWTKVQKWNTLNVCTLLRIPFGCCVSISLLLHWLVQLNSQSESFFFCRQATI